MADKIETFIFRILVTHYISTCYNTKTDLQNVYKDIRILRIMNYGGGKVEGRRERDE